MRSLLYSQGLFAENCQLPLFAQSRPSLIDCAKSAKPIDLHTDRDEPSELTYLEDAIINAGIAYGWFVCFLRDGDIPPLPATARELLCALDSLGKEINRPVWEQAVTRGQDEACGDKVIAALEMM
ncbi:hypothetical protein [Pantoea sp. 9140]|uniref:hypothetical protein n=1 Tax=Pantoea sp. 9140 TaxID=1500896 RepID=UPI0018CFC8F1|nr:hypothetical protein [Pantoea sp. 9140]